MTCKHDFTCFVGVAIFEDKPGNGSIEVKGHCKHCGTPLVFQGPRGASAPFPVASVAREELRAPVTFGHDVEFKPGATVMIDGPEINPPLRQ